jgi:hypothetical protein
MHNEKLLCWKSLCPSLVNGGHETLGDNEAAGAYAIVLIDDTRSYRPFSG